MKHKQRLIRRARGHLVRLSCFWFALTLHTTNTASAGNNVWTSIGPEGGPPSCFD